VLVRPTTNEANHDEPLHGPGRRRRGSEDLLEEKAISTMMTSVKALLGASSRKSVTTDADCAS
jgi:hypothetical protein